MKQLKLTAIDVHEEEFITTIGEEYLEKYWKEIISPGDVISNWAEFERKTKLKVSGTARTTKAMNEKILSRYYIWERVARSNKLIVTDVYSKPLKKKLKGKYVEYVESILIDLLLENCKEQPYCELVLTYNELFVALGMANSNYTNKMFPVVDELSEAAQELLPLIDIASVNDRCNKLAFDRMRTAVLGAKVQLYKNEVLDWSTTFLVTEKESNVIRFATTHEKVFLHSCIIECIDAGILPYERSRSKSKCQAKISKFKQAVLNKYHTTYTTNRAELVKYSPVHRIIATKYILNRCKSSGDNKHKLNLAIFEMLLASLYKEFSKTIVDNLSLEEYREEKQAGQSVIGIRSEEIEITNHIMKKKIELPRQELQFQ